MKIVRDLVNELKGIVGKTQIIKDIHSKKLKAELIGKQFVIQDRDAEKYINQRKAEVANAGSLNSPAK